MNNRKGLTRLEVVVTAAGLLLLVINLQAFSGIGRERSKKEVCLANLRMLAAAWQTYSNDNSGKIPVGDVYYSWIFPVSGGSSGGPQLAWREWPHQSPHPMPPSTSTNYTCAYPYGAQITQADWEHATAEGTMWKYVGDYNIYRCPSAGKDQYVTYNMSQSMNTYPGASGTGAVTITNINQIAKPAERFVFLDVGAAKQGAFYVNYNASGGGGGGPGSWYDSPPRHHNMGTTFVFADGHAIYRQWTDPHTITFQQGWGGGTVDYCDCDLRWMVKVTWGSVPFNCTDPAKNCEY
jgi:hypothetical protein